MPTWAGDGGTKCHSTVQWLRLDRPDALRFVRCGFVAGDRQAFRACVDRTFGTSFAG